ncbi:hypothetical protein M3180_06430 [Paenibacillus camelliae]|nr:hypothetical protein [Paenibacillus camelliae]
MDKPFFEGYKPNFYFKTIPGEVIIPLYLKSKENTKEKDGAYRETSQ